MGCEGGPGARREAFAERLFADPAAVRARVRDTLEQCAEAFSDAAWTDVAVRLATDLRLIPSVFGRPHLVAVHAPGWQPVIQYPVAEPAHHR